MKAAEFSKLCVEIFGEHGWQTRAAEALKIDGSTVRRYVSGAMGIPGPVEAAIRCWAKTGRD